MKLVFGLIITCLIVFDRANASPSSPDINVDKFNSVRDLYFKIAASKDDPAHGIKKLYGQFSNEISPLQNGIISKKTDCTPPVALTEKEDRSLFTAYCASYIAFEARDSLWPLQKWNLANKSLALLDNAVNESSLSIEVRALRLAVTHHLPFFFKRNKQAKADLQWIETRLRNCKERNDGDPKCTTDKTIMSLINLISH